MSELAGEQSSEDILALCQARGPLTFPMLQWIIGSNSSHIVSLPPQRRIACLGTDMQFLLASQSPEKEGRFQRLKKEHGSHFGFHGSRPENWHSIIRGGLKNASGTKVREDR